MLEASLEFVGTATTLLRLGPFTLLTDPNFLHRGQRAYLGKGLFSRRLTEPSCSPSICPPWTPSSCPTCTAITSTGWPGPSWTARSRAHHARGRRTLASWGFLAARAMATWESHRLEASGASLSVTSVPGQHAPGPCASCCRR